MRQKTMRHQLLKRTPNLQAMKFKCLSARKYLLAHKMFLQFLVSHCFWAPAFAHCCTLG